MKINEYQTNCHAEAVRLANTKTAIATAIEGKGVTVPEGTLLDGMAALIESIEAGGGNFSVQTGSITFAESYKPESTPLVISHSLGKKPFAFIAYNGAAGNKPRYQIAYLYKLGSHIGSSTAMRSTYSTIMYASSAGADALNSSSASDTIKLSSDAITISGTSTVADFNPSTPGSHPATLVWFAIAQN